MTGGIAVPGATGTDLAAVADLNGDDLPDVVVTDPLGMGLAVAFQSSPATSPPSFDRVVPLRGPGAPSALAVGDLDGDGLADLVVAFAAEDRVAVYYQRPGGDKDPAAALYGPLLLQAGGLPSALAILDVDGDGRPDLAVTSRDTGTLNVFLGR